MGWWRGEGGGAEEKKCKGVTLLYSYKDGYTIKSEYFRSFNIYKK